MLLLMLAFLAAIPKHNSSHAEVAYFATKRTCRPFLAYFPKGAPDYTYSAVTTTRI